jgi:hypothetical protein
MTPQEKSEELIKKFSPLVNTWDCYWDAPRNEDDVIVDAKQCAIIAVDEIIEALFSNDEHITLKRKFFLEVKQELEKL